MWRKVKLVIGCISEKRVKGSSFCWFYWILVDKFVVGSVCLEIFQLHELKLILYCLVLWKTWATSSNLASRKNQVLNLFGVFFVFLGHNEGSKQWIHAQFRRRCVLSFYLFELLSSIYLFIYFSNQTWSCSVTWLFSRKMLIICCQIDLIVFSWRKKYAYVFFDVMKAIID